MAALKEIQGAKLHLRTILEENNFDTENKIVVEAIENLSKLWKEHLESNEEDAPSKSPQLCGEWEILTTPQFPGRIINEENPDKFQYTLGRMSFNLFEPRNARVSVVHPGVRNSVQKINEKTAEEEDKEIEKYKTTYNVANNIIIHTDDGDLPAELAVEGFCFPETNFRLTVGFTVGDLRKRPEVNYDDGKLSELWNKAFGGIYAQTEKERGYVETAQRWLLKKVLNMTMPSDESMRYEMKRTMHGYLDILYLDDEMRITRGNRGSVVIVERIKTTEKHHFDNLAPSKLEKN